MIVAVNKQEKECAIVDIAVAGDKRIVENVKKYQELKGTLYGMPWTYFHGNRWDSMEVFLTVCTKLFKGAMSRYFLPF